MKILIVRGSEGSLEEHGMEALAKDAGMVIHLPLGEQTRVLDRFGQVYETDYVDIDGVDLALVECLERIKREWENSHDEAHLGHAVAGKWLFYWFSPDMTPTLDLVRQNRADDLRAACADFIESGFGGDRGPTLAVEVAG